MVPISVQKDTSHTIMKMQKEEEPKNNTKFDYFHLKTLTEGNTLCTTLKYDTAAGTQKWVPWLNVF